MYRLDTCQVLIMLLAPAMGSIEIKRGVVLTSLLMGGKTVKSHFVTSNSSNKHSSFSQDQK